MVKFSVQDLEEMLRLAKVEEEIELSRAGTLCTDHSSDISFKSWLDDVYVVDDIWTDSSFSKLLFNASSKLSVEEKAQQAMLSMLGLTTMQSLIAVEKVLNNDGDLFGIVNQLTSRDSCANYAGLGLNKFIQLAIGIPGGVQAYAVAFKVFVGIASYLGRLDICVTMMRVHKCMDIDYKRQLMIDTPLVPFDFNLSVYGLWLYDSNFDAFLLLDNGRLKKLSVLADFVFHAVIARSGVLNRMSMERFTEITVELNTLSFYKQRAVARLQDYLDLKYCITNLGQVKAAIGIACIHDFEYALSFCATMVEDVNVEWMNIANILFRPVAIRKQD